MTDNIQTIKAQFMKNQCHHIVSGETVQEALEFGNYGDADTDISQQDSTGGFDLRGIKCAKCGELVDISYQQTEEDKKYVTIDMESFEELEVSYQLYREGKSQ